MSLVSASPVPIRKSWEDKRQTDDADSVTVTDFSGGTGDGTFYATGLGACGITNVDTDMIAAIGEDFYDQYATHMGVSNANPNDNPICNKKVIATYQGKSVTVAITDRCAGCTIPYSLDFSPSAFSVLADQSVGRIHGMTWVWADGSSSNSSSSSSSNSTSSSSSSSSSSDSDSPSGGSTTSASSSSSTGSDSSSSSSSSSSSTDSTSQSTGAGTDGSSSTSTDNSSPSSTASSSSASSSQCTCPNAT